MSSRCDHTEKAAGKAGGSGSSEFCAKRVVAQKRLIKKHEFFYNLQPLGSVNKEVTATFDSSKRSSIMLFSLSVFLEIMFKNFIALSLSSIEPFKRVSRKPLIDVIGVFSSCETFATKSFFIVSRVKIFVISLLMKFLKEN